MVLDDFDDLMHLQRQLASRVVQENEMDMQLQLLEVIQGMVKDKNKQIAKAKILAVAEIEGIENDRTEQILQSLASLGYIKQIGDYYKIT